jgi:Metallo-peptidase family M12B Reprolysin-like
MRFDWTPTGLHAIVLSSQGTIFVEPYTKGDRSTYISYFKRDFSEDAESFQCSTAEDEEPLTQTGRTKALQPVTKMVASGQTLRTYRLAIAATAEYTQVYGGGTVNGGLAAVTTTINLVNAVFERDVAIRLVLVAGETNIIFTDTATDGYTHNNADTLLNENQAKLDSIIGSGNYDIGHVLDGQDFRPSNLFYFQGRGNGRACVSGQKAKGVSILRLLEPSTTTAVWELLHEMGHQFGASHTFNGTTANCSGARVASTAYEPGTGSTIMGYRGTVATGMPYLELCSDEDLRSTDLYFHNASIEQIINYTTTGGASSCAAQIETGNNSPMVSAGPSYTIPQSTPFMLRAAGGDPDADALTYCWEQFDLGAAAPPNTDNGNRPIFRSFAPTPNATRIFPQLSDILLGTSTFGESLPITTRTMNFRVTVRDNHSGGGGVNTGATQVKVYSGSGPFTVTQPSSSTTWAAGSTQTVMWDVANTSNAPVNCANVKLSLSTDGGNTFPITLVASAPNNGVAQITVPQISTTTARVKVEAIGNIFFNISRPNFTINASNGAPPPALLTEGNTNRAIALDSVTFMRDPFPLATAYNFSADNRTRIILFAVNLELMAGEDASVVTAQAEAAGHNLYPLKVEYVGKVPNFDWLTQVVIKLPDAIASSGDVWISIRLRGVASNKVLVSIK